MAGGKKNEEVCKGLAISPATLHRWKEHYGGADVSTVKELKAVKGENARLKRLVANQALEVRRNFPASVVLAVLAALIALRGAPAYLRSDNGPEFVARAVQVWREGSRRGSIVYRAGQPVGERIDRIVQQPVAGRAFEPRRICLPVGGASPERRVAAGRQ